MYKLSKFICNARTSNVNVVWHNFKTMPLGVGLMSQNLPPAPKTHFLFDIAHPYTMPLRKNQVECFHTRILMLGVGLTVTVDHFSREVEPCSHSQACIQVLGLVLVRAISSKDSTIRQIQNTCICALFSGHAEFVLYIW